MRVSMTFRKHDPQKEAAIFATRKAREQKRRLSESARPSKSQKTFHQNSGNVVNLIASYIAHDPSKLKFCTGMSHCNHKGFCLGCRCHVDDERLALRCMCAKEEGCFHIPGELWKVAQRRAAWLWNRFGSASVGTA